MYPARWFPIAGYTTDRFSAVTTVSVPAGYKVLGSGIDTSDTAGARTVYKFQFDRASFPGSIAVVKGPGKPVMSEGVTTTLYFRGAEQEVAGVYGDEAGAIAADPNRQGGKTLRPLLG